MNRRNFITTCMAGVTAVFMPWRKVKATPVPEVFDVREIIQDVIDSRGFVAGPSRSITGATISSATFTFDVVSVEGSAGTMIIYDADIEDAGVWNGDEWMVGQ